jgi:hypothetical protein
MKSVSIVVVLCLAVVSNVLAAPGDPVALRGTLAWPPTLTGEPFAVVQGDDGRVVYADLSGAQRRGSISAGGRLSLLGVEGGKPHEVTTVAIGPGDSVLAALPPGAPGTAPAPTSPPPSAPPAAMRTPPPPMEDRQTERIEGILETLGDKSITVKTSNGVSVNIDVSRLGTKVLGTLKPGDRVTVLARVAQDKSLTAIGFVHLAPRAEPK